MALLSDFYSLLVRYKRDKKPLVLVVIALALVGNSPAYASNPQVELYKLYAHMQVGNDKQYRCLVQLWHMESRWSPTADNKKSSAYGIPQLLKMKERNPYRQIDLGLKYITKRYETPCLALAWHKKKGHY